MPQKIDPKLSKFEAALLRSAKEAANSGIPVKIGMALRTHNTLAIFMRNVDTEDDLVRLIAERIASR